jgi:hypothetical protein
LGLLPALQSCRVVDDHPAIPNASDHFPLSAEFNFTDTTESVDPLLMKMQMLSMPKEEW